MQVVCVLTQVGTVHSERVPTRWRCQRYWRYYYCNNVIVVVGCLLTCVDGLRVGCITREYCWAARGVTESRTADAEHSDGVTALRRRAFGGCYAPSFTCAPLSLLSLSTNVTTIQWLLRNNYPRPDLCYLPHSPHEKGCLCRTVWGRYTRRFGQPLVTPALSSDDTRMTVGVWLGSSWVDVPHRFSRLEYYIHVVRLDEGGGGDVHTWFRSPSPS